MILHGNCLDKLKDLSDNSIDSIVTDPPYGLSFMNKHWDYSVPSKEIWIEALRVLKPGGHLLSFGGTRTYHRLVIAIEDAGFEIRDQIQWIYSSGFPKSLSIDKAIDKAAGAERVPTGKPKPGHEKFIGRESSNFQQWDRPSLNDPEWQRKYHEETAPATDDAKQWQGWGTALKPANEPICVARKPLSEKTVAKNVLKYGTGALNIDASRIGTTDKIPVVSNQNITGGKFCSDNSKRESVSTFTQHTAGRWPANVLFDEAAASVLDEQTKDQRASKPSATGTKFKATGAFPIENERPISHKDAGGASRFFYCAKASKSERGEGNIHPTVKPVKLMEYLIKLITPPNGIVLDPFMGSGTTGVAANNIGFDFIGIEMNQDYIEIAEKRIKNVN